MRLGVSGSSSAGTYSVAEEHASSARITTARDSSMAADDVAHRFEPAAPSPSPPSASHPSPLATVKPRAKKALSTPWSR